MLLVSPPPDEGRSVADAAAAGMPSFLIIVHERCRGRCRPASSAAVAAAATVAVIAAAADDDTTTQQRRSHQRPRQRTAR
jgi:hypothetical protein